MIPSIGSESRNRQYIDMPAHLAYGMKKVALDSLGYDIGDLVKYVYIEAGHPDTTICVTDIEAVIYAQDRHVTIECRGRYYNVFSRKMQTVNWRPRAGIRPIWRECNQGC